MTLKEIEDQERQLGADAEELDYTLKIMRGQMFNGYLWGKAYSVACPDGEYGLTPIRSATRITKEEFDNAQAAEWTN